MNRFTPAHRLELIGTIRDFPHYLEETVRHLSAEELTTPYLAGEWTVAQNVHHLADSHMNAFIRVKLTVTEEYPTVRPYHQDDWAVTPDANHAEIGVSILILTGLHQRWADLFLSLSEDQWHRKAYHPENGDMTVEDFLRTYAAHGEGHLDQIGRTLRAKPE
jgi:hypothetical protein